MKKIILTALMAFILTGSIYADTPQNVQKKICDFLTSMYIDPDVNIYDENWIKRHCSKSLQKYLREEYEYDGEGYAMWLLEGQGPGEDVISDLSGVTFVNHNGKQMAKAELHRYNIMVEYDRTIYFDCTYNAAKDNIIINSVEWGEDVGRTMPVSETFNQTIPVEGGAGIMQFVQALKPFVDMRDDVKPIIDTKAGYFLYSEEGFKEMEFCVTYWNRTDKSKLVMANYHVTRGLPGNSEEFSYTQAFIYNNAKQCLEPIDMPAKGGPDYISYCFMILPRQGKDILIRTNYDEDKMHKLKWNGMTFNFVK